MLEECSLTLMNGGYYECTPAWDKESDAFDRCLKFWYPVAGEAHVVVDDVPRHVRPGSIYFISGYHQQRHSCATSMNLYWVHFVPEDLYMSHLLSSVPPFYHWPAERMELWQSTFRRLPRLFESNEDRMFPLSPERPTGLTWRVEALLLYLISDLIEFNNPDEAGWDSKTFGELRSAIEFMDRSFREAPDLATIAEQVYMSPRSFHRKFKDAFHLTPHEYVTRKRMNLANHLLATTTFSIKEVADRVGFDNAFYFSRAFKQHFGVSPSTRRETAV